MSAAVSTKGCRVGLGLRSGCHAIPSRRGGGAGLMEMTATLGSATAFSHRAEHYDFLILSQWSDPADSERNLEWTSALFEAMQPHLEESVYVNNLGDEGQGRVQAAYGDNYPRLAALKAAYDPDNLFRANQNIDLSAHTASGQR
jgi:hypothetical protein